MAKITAVAIFFLTVWVGVAITQAQIVKSTIVGSVRDASGAVIPGVTIKVTNLATNVTQTTVTDDTGNYVVPFLDSGEYRVTAELPGFKMAVEPRAQLDVA